MHVMFVLKASKWKSMCGGLQILLYIREFSDKSLVSFPQYLQGNARIASLKNLNSPQPLPL